MVLSAPTWMPAPGRRTTTSILRQWVIAVVLAASESRAWIQPRSHPKLLPIGWQPLTRSALHAGGGFGFSAKGKEKKKSKKKKLNRKAFAFDELSTARAPAADSATQNLDKWGLPPPTLDDIFPPMPEGTELIPCDKDHQYSLDDVRDALKEHMALPGLDNFFDKRGLQKNCDTDSPMQVKLLHVSPPVLVIENFLTPEECVDIENVAEQEGGDGNAGTGAVQVDSATFALSQSTRTSTSWFCHFFQVPTLLAKMQHVVGLPLDQMEEPQIVRYKSGQEFSYHYDEVPPAQLANGGQRLATLLVYLNTVEKAESGGATVFRDLKDATGEPLAVRPRQGRACLFFPALADGTPDDRTLHKGEILAQDAEKRIVQVWTHERPYAPVLPAGNTQEAARASIEEAMSSIEA